MEYKLTAPMTREQARQLRCGDTVLFTGTIYTARDAAHKRLVELLDQGKPLPFDVDGAVIYFADPPPATAWMHMPPKSSPPDPPA